MKQPWPDVPQVSCHESSVHGSTVVGSNSALGRVHGPCGAGAVETPKPHQGVGFTYHSKPQPYIEPYM
ncbi:hypothetical protein RGF97_03505 [Streptomyces roseicoloratus]|uniref:Uncharacterized protein n=1 Tax=Streptomyces roseicoloratus TaxID=2508722 RepID=A0ABY9RQY4_9ACTN|nr:hypothetical protein [Streptomyces roseicoloratus]WMX44113.1 hypothetical protein RGF97_03505 [Streptomyces roseicoloratus]